MKKFFEKVNSFELALCYILLIFMLVLGTANVFCRYVLNSTIEWGELLCRYALLWISMISASAIVLPKRHLRVDLIDSLLIKGRKKLALVIETFVNLVSIAFYAFIFYWGVDLVNRTIMNDPLLGFPMKVVYAILPIGAALMIIRTIQSTIVDIVHKGPMDAEEEIVLVSADDGGVAEDGENNDTATGGDTAGGE